MKRRYFKIFPFLGTSFYFPFGWALGGDFHEFSSSGSVLQICGKFISNGYIFSSELFSENKIMFNFLKIFLLVI